MSAPRYFWAVRVLSGKLHAPSNDLFETVEAAQDALFKWLLCLICTQRRVMVVDGDDIVIVQSPALRVVRLFQATNGGEWVDVSQPDEVKL